MPCWKRSRFGQTHCEFCNHPITKLAEGSNAGRSRFYREHYAGENGCVPAGTLPAFPRNIVPGFELADSDEEAGGSGHEDGATMEVVEDPPAELGEHDAGGSMGGRSSSSSQGCSSQDAAGDSGLLSDSDGSWNRSTLPSVSPLLDHIQSRTSTTSHALLFPKYAPIVFEAFRYPLCCIVLSAKHIASG